MGRRQAVRWAVPCLLLALAACGGAASRRPNLVVITVDTLRADSLGVYGNLGGHSPNIDRLASEAVVFDRAVSAIGTTLPSHATLFTGLYPKRHRVRWNGDALADEFTTLAEILAAAGYDTAAFVSLGSLVHHGGLQQGISSGPSGQEPWKIEDGESVNARAIDWLSAGRERPFFVWLHYFEPHSPYPPTPYSRRALAGYQGPLADGASHEDYLSIDRDSPEDLRALRVLYDGGVRQADRRVGEILDTLGRRGLAAETVVVFAADHGESLGEHGLFGHGFVLSQPVLHVPLIIRVPGAAPRRVATRVGLVDVLPSLLELAGEPIPQDLDGRSLAPALFGDRLPPRPYFAETRGIDTRPRPSREEEASEQLAQRLFRSLERDPGAVAVFERDLKGIRTFEGFLAYDLAADPRELSPLAPDSADPRLAALRDATRGYHSDTTIEASRLEHNEALRQQLQALGYID